MESPKLGIDEKVAYLYGLVLGRGRHLPSQNRILIEFAHKNEVIGGITHCDKCGWLATRNKGQLKCKNQTCRSVVSEDTRKKYNQIEGTRDSVQNEIKGMFESETCNAFISTSAKSTHLIMNFSDGDEIYKKFTQYCSDDANHKNLSLNRKIDSWGIPAKIELINGLLDTAGFPNSGGWLNRDTPFGTGRMRCYFQIVRNWNLTVELDNFLRREFKIPIQTIDWGHPNIRSSRGAEASASSVDREHQLKFFPEYFTGFKFRIKHKQLLFNELTEHNLKLKFNNTEDWFPPRPIPASQFKPTHPDEDDIRLPPAVRMHFDAFWQINLALGCEFMRSEAETSSNPRVYALTGEKDSTESYEKVFEQLASDRLVARRVVPNVTTTSGRRRANFEDSEFATYEPLRKWLENFMRVNSDPNSIAWITSDRNLSRFLQNLSYENIDLIDGIEDLRIRPDIVGFSAKSQKFSFIESKITKLNILEIGQLMGYCLVAQPENAFLISTKPVEDYVLNLIKEVPEIVQYSDSKKIQLVHFDSRTMTSPKIY